MPRTRRTAQLQLEFVRLAGPWRQKNKLAAALAPACATIIAHTAKLPPGNYQITIALTDDAQQRALNAQFRGINRATNVLAFPQFSTRALGRLSGPKTPIALGDISLAYQYIVTESKKDHKILIHHIIHLVIHGILHILGYDHHSARHAAKMETLERTILATMHIADPYATPVVANRQQARSRRP